MRKLIYGMNLTLDGYIAAPGDEYAIVTHSILVGGGTPFFTALDSWVNLTWWRRGRFPAAWS